MWCWLFFLIPSHILNTFPPPVSALGKPRASPESCRRKMRQLNVQSITFYEVYYATRQVDVPWVDLYTRVGEQKASSITLKERCEYFVDGGRL